jgi:uncharacterized damage-inducible protein DinB
MKSMIKPILESYRFSNFVVDIALSDMKNEDAVKRLGGDRGPSISWEIGHVGSYRGWVLELLGEKIDNPFGTEFDDEAKSEGGDYPDIKELGARWNELRPVLESALEAVTDERLTSPLKPDSPKMLLESLTFFSWHEAYHLGQVGSLRTHLGYEAISTLAAAKSKEHSA